MIEPTEHQPRVMCVLDLKNPLCSFISTRGRSIDDRSRELEARPTTSMSVCPFHSSVHVYISIVSLQGLHAKPSCIRLLYRDSRQGHPAFAVRSSLGFELEAAGLIDLTLPDQSRDHPESF
jgi:hypothetical protein